MPTTRLPFELAPALLARYKAATGLTSNYAVAKRLGVTPQAVGFWEKGRGMDVTTALQIAEALGIPPMATIAEVHLEQAKTPRERAIWEKYCARVVVAALVAVATLCPSSRQSLEFTISGNMRQSIHYASAAVVRWIQRQLVAVLLTLARTRRRQGSPSTPIAYATR